MTSRWTIRARLTAWYLAVLIPATLLLAVGSRLVMRHSLDDAADAHLLTRIASATRMIVGMEHELSISEIRDEFREYSDLTLGDGLLEVSDGSGVVWCRPPTNGWDALRAKIIVPEPGTPPVLTDGLLDDRPVRVVAASTQEGGRRFQIVAAIPTGPSEDALRRFGWVLAALVPGVLLICGLGGLWISRRALAPVDQLTQDVNALTLQSLNRRLDVPAANDELHRLAVTFNDLLERLESGVADMTRFTADAAHELRTPVTLVRTTAEVALGRDRSSDEYRSALGEIQQHAEQMSTLVGDLLVLARLDAGVESRSDGPIDLSALVCEAIQGSQSMARAAGLTLTCEAQPGVMTTGDAVSLKRVLAILIDNAVRYTPASGSVRVSVARDSASDGRQAAVVEVADTGIGIGDLDRARVFDRFYRGSEARQRMADGAGLGLSIAAAIVRRHRGTIAVMPKSQSGARLRVELPS
jgi:heavy metal sensor kinase